MNTEIRSLVLTCLIWAAWLVSAAVAQDADEPVAAPRGQQWAVLIGVEHYQHVPQLRFTSNDVVRLARTLNQRGGFSRTNVLQVTDAAEQPRRQPLRATLLAELPRWLAKPGPDDQIVVYFSGHGFRDADGTMYLAPVDCDAKRPAETGIAVEWLRDQLAHCKAAFKLLVLDACHAGSEKGDASADVSAKDLGEPFRELPGVVTLASSTADETSQIWEEKEQSLFSFWLDQGLKGSADENGDNAVDVDELYKFVHRSVVNSARQRFHRPQTPVRIVRSGTSGVPVVLRLRPQTLDQVLAEMAEQLAWAMEESGEPKLGVLEFSNDTKRGELLGAEFGTLGRYCASQLQARLMKLGAGTFSLVDEKRLQSALSAQRMSLAQLASTKALKGLAKEAGGMPVVAEGVLRWRSGNIVNLQCKLVRTDADDIVGEAGGTAALNESELGMTGKSFQVKPQDRRRPVEVPHDIGGGEAATMIANHFTEQAHGPHPLRDSKFPYQIWLTVKGRKRDPIFALSDVNDMYVSLDPGEVYEIHVKNLSGQLVLMRLLVDGLNTLPERLLEKGVQTVQVAKRVNLSEARHWVLDPKQSTYFAVRGFVTETGANGKLREFKVVDAAKSLAARQEFTEQVGLITAAFYAPGGGARSYTPEYGTDFGDERKENLIERAGTKVGNLLAVVNIHYGGGGELDDRR